VANAAEDLSPAEMYGEHCQGCHDNPQARAPTLQAMQQMNVSTLMFAMSNGKMRTQASALEQAQIYELAVHIVGDRDDDASIESTCADNSIAPGKMYASQWGVNQRKTARSTDDTTNITSTNVATLSLDWVFELPDAADARSQPVVMGDSLFIATTAGDLLALDRFSGCVKWHYRAPAPIRTALTLNLVSDDDTPAYRLYFGDAESHTSAVDAQSGELLWRTDTAVSPHSIQTGAVVHHRGKLYVPVSLYEVILAQDPHHECCISHGAVSRLDAGTGNIEWTTHMTAAPVIQGTNRDGVTQWGPSGVPVWATPTVDDRRGLLYVGTGQNASSPATQYSDSVIALDLNDGTVKWHFQGTAGDTYNSACSQLPKGANCPRWQGPDFDFGASVILTTDSSGREILLAGQKSGDVYALDPDQQGDIIWRQRLGKGSMLGGIHWGMAASAGTLYAATNDPPFGNSNPSPGLFALDVDDGDILWSYTLSRGCDTTFEAYFQRTEMYPDCSYYYAFSAALAIAGDVVFAPALDGKIRAFNTRDGELLWQFDTARSFTTVNGTSAHGGAMDNSAVVFAADHIYLQSGYSLFGQLPGNVLMAFSIEPDQG
jgi:polyvinyl alcohol dehydrogenase (cytochrome)